MRRDIWIFLFILGMLLFGWPFLIIFREKLAYYLFISWLIFIALVYLASRFSEGGDGGK